MLPPDGPAPDDGPWSPEALVIAALLEDGEFTPDRLHLRREMVEAYEAAWDRCLDYQRVAGCAPPPRLAATWFPELAAVPVVDLSWAAANLRRAHVLRQGRRAARDMLAAIAEQDVDGLYAATSSLPRLPGAARRAVDALDQATVADEVEAARLPVPYPTLAAATGGIRSGELWYVVARTGTGKTWQLCLYAATAAEAGARVAYLSLEMPADRVARRLQRCLARNRQPVLRGLSSAVEAERKVALDELAAVVPGRVEVLDTSAGPVTTTAVADAMADAQLVVVDHVGLMRTDTGGHAVDDWRSMAVISNGLKWEALRSGVPVLAAAQANREADNGVGRPPRISQISQADALGQDADVVVTLAKLSPSVRAHSAEKVREGLEPGWFSRFDPGRGRYEEVSRDFAYELAAADAEREHR